MGRSETRSVALAARFDEVFDFLSDPKNLHLWTVDFAIAPPAPTGERRDGHDVYAVPTPRGALSLYVLATARPG